MLLERLAALEARLDVSSPRNDYGIEATAPCKKFSVVSLFSGCGGMDLGFRGGFEFLGRHQEVLPFSIIWANDLNLEACRTYKRNLGSDIHIGSIWDHLNSLPKAEDVDVVIGGFPCQDISVNGKGAGVDGKRSGLYRAMVEVVRKLKPKVFVAENVKGLLMRHNADSLARVIADFKALGYELSVSLHNAAEHGVPQSRERVFIVGTAPGIKPFQPPKAELKKSEWISAREAIGDLQNRPEAPDWHHIWSKARPSAEQGSRRLKADRPAYTIRAECHGNIQFHYDIDRRISMREAARIQSFPDNFIFQSKLRETERQIGNAVPPLLAWHIAKAVLDVLV